MAFLNVKPIDGLGVVKYVSFHDDVHEWQPVPHQDPTVTIASTMTSDNTADSNETEVISAFLGSHTSNNRFYNAKLQELAKWKEMGTYEEVEFHNQNLISTSWVCTEKLKGGTLTCKARLVARGFEEDSTMLKKESPTCAKDSLRIMLIITMSYCWCIKSLDIKSAFLQGMKLQRDVFIKPPPEAKVHGIIWKLNYAVYGLTDASRHFYDRVESELIKLGAFVSKLDPALFYFIHDGVLQGILVVHVDDFLYAGTTSFHETVIKKLFEVFVVGSEAKQSMKFLGYNLVQNKGCVSVSLKQYVDLINPVKVSSDRAKLKEASLSNEEYSDFRHVLGQINWCAGQVRLDIAFDNCFLSNSSSKPCI